MGKGVSVPTGDPEVRFQANLLHAARRLNSATRGQVGDPRAFLRNWTSDLLTAASDAEHETGDRISPRTAVEIGLVRRICAHMELMSWKTDRVFRSTP